MNNCGLCIQRTERLGNTIRASLISWRTCCAAWYLGSKCPCMVLECTWCRCRDLGPTWASCLAISSRSRCWWLVSGHACSAEEINYIMHGNWSGNPYTAMISVPVITSRASRLPCSLLLHFSPNSLQHCVTSSLRNSGQSTHVHIFHTLQSSHNP